MSLYASCVIVPIDDKDADVSLSFFSPGSVAFYRLRTVEDGLAGMNYPSTTAYVQGLAGTAFPVEITGPIATAIFRSSPVPIMSCRLNFRVM